MVKFSIPNIPSLTSTTPDPAPSWWNSDKAPILMMPDISYLTKLAEGDVGIADAFIAKLMEAGLGAIKSQEGFEDFLRASKATEKTKSANSFNQGKFSYNLDSLDLSSLTNSLGGMKALEKALVQSILETQKPYIELIKIITESLVDAEDIIARVLAISGRSLKPRYNPRAFGYNKDGVNKLATAVADIETFLNKYAQKNASDTTNTNDIINSNTTSNQQGYKILSTEYSTGTFNSKVNYDYTYIDLPADDTKDYTVPPKKEREEPKRPEMLVFGIYDSNGNPASNDILGAVFSHITSSPKWYGQFDMIRDFKYVYTKPGNADVISDSSPADDWSLKRDSSGVPMMELAPNTQILIPHTNLIKDESSDKLDELGITGAKKEEALAEVVKTSNIQQLISSVVGGGFLPSINNNTSDNAVPIPKYPYQPKKISYDNKQVWIDPETQYLMKVVEIVPSFASGNDIGGANNSEPYSDGWYGTPTVDDRQQSGTKTFVPFTSLVVPGSYYIVEGILEDSPTSEAQDRQTGRSNDGGSQYYKFRHSFTAISKFSNLLTRIISKLLPQASSIIELGTNPAEFILSIIMKKLGDNSGTEAPRFGFLSKPFIDTFNEMKSLPVPDRKAFVDKSILKEYVYIDELGNYKFLLDGDYVFDFFGVANMGIDITDNTPIPVFELKKRNHKHINKLDRVVDDTGVAYISSDKKNVQDSNSSRLGSSDGGSNSDYEVTSIVYSTGTYNPAYRYTYIYVDDFTQDLINQATSAYDKGDYKSAETLLKTVVSINPHIPSIAELLQNIGSLLSITENPILRLIISLVSLPFKIILSIVEYIFNFFKELTNPFTLLSKLTNFMSFEWLLDFFKVDGVLGLAGIKLDIPKFMLWSKTASFLNIKKYDAYGNWVNKDSYTDLLYDMSQVFQFPILGKLPTLNLEQFLNFIQDKDSTGKKMISAHQSFLKLLTNILCLIEAIINSFIDLVWSVAGITAIMPPPHIKLCRKTNEDLSPKEIMDILNGTYTDIITQDTVGGEDTNVYDFAFDIKLPDGTNVRDLNRTQLQDWMTEHSNYNYEFFN
jgi:hypothetical protein